MSLLTNFQHTWASQRAAMLVLNVEYYWYHALAPHCQPISSPFIEQTHRVSINSCLASTPSLQGGWCWFLLIPLPGAVPLLVFGSPTSSSEHPLWAAGYLITSSTPLLPSFPGLHNAVWAGFPPYSCQHKKSRDRQQMRVHVDWYEVRNLWLVIQMDLWKYIQQAPQTAP